jgi:hypothetical protein
VRRVLVGSSVLGRLAPSAFRWLISPQPAQIHLTEAVGQVGVVLLVGIIGADLDFGLVRRRGATAARVGIAGLVLPLALGVAAGYLAPRSLMPAGAQRTLFVLFVGVAMSVSALPVVAKTLGDMGLMHRDFAQLTIAAGVVDDIVGWLLLSVISAVGAGGLRWAAAGRELLWLAALILFGATIGCRLTRVALAVAGRTRDGGHAGGPGRAAGPVRGAPRHAVPASPGPPGPPRRHAQETGRADRGDDAAVSRRPRPPDHHPRNRPAVGRRGHLRARSSPRSARTSAGTSPTRRTWHPGPGPAPATTSPPAGSAPGNAARAASTCSPSWSSAPGPRSATRAT